MNPHKYFASAELMSKPLCGINTYKDILNLATGQMERKIKKLVVDGTENWSGYNLSASGIGATLIISDMLSNGRQNGFCTHFPAQYSPSQSTLNGITFGAGNNTIYITFSAASASALNITDTASIKAWFAKQYISEAPVTIWYVLATQTTETITLPSGLSGTVEGYLNQSGTPTPTNPIYLTANTAKGWYTINAYKRSVLVWNTDTAYKRGNGSWT